MQFMFQAVVSCRTLNVAREGESHSFISFWLQQEPKESRCLCVRVYYAKEDSRRVLRERDQGRALERAQKRAQESKRLEVIHLEEKEEPCPVGAC